MIEKDLEKVMTYNVGSSDYSTKKVQPWDLWVYINCPWDADIIKRIGRVKKTDGRMLDLDKLIHISLKRITLIKDGYTVDLNQNCPIDLVELYCQERNMSSEERDIVHLIMYGDTNNASTFERIIELVEILKSYEDTNFVGE